MAWPELRGCGTAEASRIGEVFCSGRYEMDANNLDVCVIRSILTTYREDKYPGISRVAAFEEIVFSVATTSAVRPSPSLTQINERHFPASVCYHGPAHNDALILAWYRLFAHGCARPG
jgi:hypothetical protein